MGKIKYDLNLIKTMSIFETATNAKLKDAVNYDNQILFIVEENQIGKAIGKKGQNAKNLERVFNRKIKIVEFSDNVIRFIENLIYPLKAKEINKEKDEINKEDKRIIIVGKDKKTKGQIIGRDSKNIKFLNDIVKRHFDVEEIKVI